MQPFKNIERGKMNDRDIRKISVCGCEILEFLFNILLFSLSLVTNSSQVTSVTLSPTSGLLNLYLKYFFILNSPI